ncbi:TetR/AcrR family transcriptional regulator [Gordonia insulae]|uniref:Putative HTH-type transcriptional regulator n=1 Tax=Gordonia insulae TaxID=2420509 RepID=A0A3G8JR12_9ACTN|nr:TetR/AcrR family transcriptional regulator [Gordonia insulae]AZG47571.1 putative HTH-type transcriptional regulator [Gordonia insulae]
MSPPKSARTPATEVRANLLAAGRRILERDGVAALTVRAVATKAGVAPMGVYNHFDGKEGLLNALVTDGFAEFAGLIAATDADPSTRLLNSGRNYRGFAVANPTLYTLMFSMDCEAESEVAARAFFELVDIVKYGQVAGMIRPGEPEQLAAQIWACVHGAVALELASSYPPFIDPSAAYEQVIRLIARGVAA